MRSKTAIKGSAPFELKKALSAIGSHLRWRMLVELMKGEALPAAEIARRLRISGQVASRHLILLREGGILERGYGNLYRIPKQFLVEGQQAIDLGAFVLRLDYAPRGRE